MLTTHEGRIIVFDNEIKPESHRRFLFSRFSPEDFAVAYAPVIPALSTMDSILVYGKSIAIYELNKDVEEE
jgi:hypothetical protein